MKKINWIKIKPKTWWEKNKNQITKENTYSFWFERIVEDNCCGDIGKIVQIDREDTILPYYIKVKSYYYWVSEE